MGGPCSRRRFLGLAAAAPLAVASGCGGSSGSPSSPSPSPTAPPPSSGSGIVALTRARAYGAEAAGAMRQAFDLLGGTSSLVRGKTVTVKVNLTGWPFQSIGGRLPGMPQLARMKPGSRIVSHAYDMDGVTPEKTETIESKADGARHTIYYYTIPLKKDKPKEE